MSKMERLMWGAVKISVICSIYGLCYLLLEGEVTVMVFIIAVALLAFGLFRIEEKLGNIVTVEDGE